MTFIDTLLPFKTIYAGLDMIIDYSKPELRKLFWERWAKLTEEEIDAIMEVNLKCCSTDPN